jgi:hypothetical protein
MYFNEIMIKFSSSRERERERAHREQRVDRERDRKMLYITREIFYYWYVL